ncbi:hypothetical protein [Phocaeicola coprophilus]|uniref:hypothetical protein n=1 Tax=Phocaeicola coprophilus TaxID=387090 RepID=UPI00307878EF
MFSALNQGSLVYILDKTDGVKFKIGEIVGTTVPQFAIDGSGMVMKLSIKINGNVAEYNNVPSAATIVSYNNGKFIIAETKQSIQSEVESTLHNANYIIEHIEDYKSQITQCEDVLKELNPQYAKDKARDEEIANIKSEVAGMKTNIDKILAAVTNK